MDFWLVECVRARQRVAVQQSPPNPWKLRFPGIFYTAKYRKNGLPQCMREAVFRKFSQQQEAHANNDDNHTGDVFHNQCPFGGFYVSVLPAVRQMPGIAGLDNDKDADRQGH